MQSFPSAVFTGHNQVQAACKLAGWVRPCADKEQTLFMEGQTTKPMNNSLRRLKRLLCAWRMSKHFKPVCQHKTNKVLHQNPVSHQFPQTLRPFSRLFAEVSFRLHVCPRDAFGRIEFRHVYCRSENTDDVRD